MILETAGLFNNNMPVSRMCVFDIVERLIDNFANFLSGRINTKKTNSRKEPFKSSKNPKFGRKIL